MFYKCVCISPCRVKEFEFRVGDFYYYKESINYKNEVVEYIIYRELNFNHATHSNSVKSFIGYTKLNFLRCNFMDFLRYTKLLEKVDNDYNNILWGI